MKDLQLLTASATELQALLRSGDLTSVQLVKACLDQIAKHDRSGLTLRAIVSTPPEAYVLSVADALDKERAAGNLRGPLHGIPIIIKVGAVHLSRAAQVRCLPTAYRTLSTPIPRLACQQPSVHMLSRNLDLRATPLLCRR